MLDRGSLLLPFRSVASAFSNDSPATTQALIQSIGFQHPIFTAYFPQFNNSIFPSPYPPLQFFSAMAWITLETIGDPERLARVLREETRKVVSEEGKIKPHYNLSTFQDPLQLNNFHTRVDQKGTFAQSCDDERTYSLAAVRHRPDLPNTQTSG
jgi:hypothetical protein